MVLVAVQLSVLGLYLPAGVQIASTAIPSAPDDHFAAGPHCRVKVSASGRVGGAGGCPTVGAGIVSPAGVQKAADDHSAPDDHFAAGPNCRVIRLGPAGALVVLVAVQLSVLGLYLPPVFKTAAAISAPDDHFAAGPYCCVTYRRIGRVGGAGGCPTIGAGIISPASVQDGCRNDSAPDDHFAAGPHCRVIASGSGRVGGAGGCPTVGAGIVSAASVQIHGAGDPSAPDDHFTAGPHCRVIVPGSGRAGGAGWRPRVIGAANRRPAVLTDPLS